MNLFLNIFSVSSFTLDNRENNNNYLKNIFDFLIDLSTHNRDLLNGKLLIDKNIYILSSTLHFYL